MLSTDKFNTATILTDDVIKVAALPPPADRRALLPSLSRPLVLTQRGSQAVEDASALAPLHNPPNLLGIRVAREIFKCPQVMCRGRRARTGAARLSILVSWLLTHVRFRNTAGGRV